MIPLKKGAYSIDGNIFTWPIALNLTGAGYLLGYGENTICKGRYFYVPRSGSPVSNDGFKVTALEARTIAKIFHGFCSGAFPLYSLPLFVPPQNGYEDTPRRRLDWLSPP